MNVPPETCPNCGADLAPDARACPQCGSCEQTGWSEEAEAGHWPAADDSFDYQQFVKEEFGPKKIIPRGVSRLWWIVAGVMAVLLLWLALR